MRNLLLSIGLVGLIVGALIMRTSVVGSQEPDGSNGSPTLAAGAPAAGSSSAGDPLEVCGAGRPGQSPLLGSFTAQRPADIHLRLPNLPSIPELAAFRPPMTVVLFDKGVFNFPVPLAVKPSGAGFWKQPHTIMCVSHDGTADFYADVDFSGWTASGN